MAALLIVGGMALTLAAVILRKSMKAETKTDEDKQRRRWVLASFFATALLWVSGLVALAVSVDWMAGNAHYIAASSLGLCILIVVEANARRHQKEDTRAASVNPLLA